MSNSTVNKLQATPTVAKPLPTVTATTAVPKFNFGAAIAPQATLLSSDSFTLTAATASKTAATEEAVKYPSVQAAMASLSESKPSGTSRFAGQFLGFTPQAKSDSGLSKEQTVNGFSNDSGNSGGGQDSRG